MKTYQGIISLAILANAFALDDGNLRGLQSTIVTPTTSMSSHAPTCPNQDPCYDMGNGYYAYKIFKVNDQDGSCREVCAGGTTLKNYFENNSGYSCGTCPSNSCPGQEPCNDYGNGFLGYSIKRVFQDGGCEDRCAGGNTLATFLKTGNYVCGTCTSEDFKYPVCAGQQPCSTSTNGVVGYYLYKVDAGMGCLESCASGPTIASLLSAGYVCGECPANAGNPTCPGQEPCQDYGNGFLGYFVKTSNANGNCQDVCAAGTTLTNYIENRGYECGACDRPSCPGEEECADYGLGYKGYPIHKMVNGMCYKGCAAGAYLTMYLTNFGYTCGGCP